MYRYALIKENKVLDMIYAPQDFIDLISSNYDLVVQETESTGVAYIGANFSDGKFIIPDEILYPAEPIEEPVLSEEVVIDEPVSESNV